MLGIHRREVGVEQFILFALNLDYTLRQVHLIQQETVLHVKVRTALDGSGLQFELDNADGLVHLCHKLCGAGSLRILGATVLRQEALAGVVGIGVHSKGC